MASSGGWRRMSIQSASAALAPFSSTPRAISSAIRRVLLVCVKKIIFTFIAFSLNYLPDPSKSLATMRFSSADAGPMIVFTKPPMTLEISALFMVATLTFPSLFW